MKRILTAILGTFVITLDGGYSWPRGPISDQTVAERAELIVVGRIIPASIKRIEHPAKPGDGTSHEHHAMLEIVETLEGRSMTTAVKIIIHYGLDSVTVRYVNTKSHYFDDRHGMPDTAKDAIEIYGTGGMDRRISGDIREPHIWLLSTKNPGYTTPDSTEFPGIWDPKDIQAATKKERKLSGNLLILKLTMVKTLQNMSGRGWSNRFSSACESRGDEGLFFQQ